MKLTADKYYGLVVTCPYYAKTWGLLFILPLIEKFESYLGLEDLKYKLKVGCGGSCLSP